MHLPWRDVPVGVDPVRPILTSLTADESAELARLAAGRTVLEIGSAYGYSTCVMGLAGAVRLISVDPHWPLASAGALAENVDHFGLTGTVQIRQATSQQVLPELFDAGQQVDMVFIDGEHLEAGVRFDLTWAERLLTPVGVLACHDYGEDCCCPDVRRVLDEMHPGKGKVTDTLWVRQ